MISEEAALADRLLTLVVVSSAADDDAAAAAWLCIGGLRMHRAKESGWQLDVGDWLEAKLEFDWDAGDADDFDVVDDPDMTGMF